MLKSDIADAIRAAKDAWGTDDFEDMPNLKELVDRLKVSDGPLDGVVSTFKDKVGEQCNKGPITTGPIGRWPLWGWAGKWAHATGPN